MRIRKTFVPFAASVAWCFMAVAPALLVESSAASFTGSHPRLSVSKSGSGSGIVRSTPAGISCGSVCSARFPLNAAITLTATASSGTLFTGWSGACSGSAAITTLVLAGGARCTASFALGSTPPPPPATQASLWITPAGTGSGLVTSSPAGISCGSTCTASYALNTSVALSASAHAGSTFSGWSGSCAGVSANTQISLAANSTCFATFTSSAYTVNPAAGTNGSIAPATAQTVAAGATTTFTITPGAGFTASVGGSCGGSLAGTTYTTNAVNGSCSVVASFSAIVAAAGVTYFVANGGNNANSCATAQSSGTPRQTIQSALACLAAGDTLVIRDGTYSGAANALANLPNGSAGKYITIRAENEGNAILTAGLQMINSDAYLTFQGLRLQDSLGRSILGNHLKFFRNEFKGGCASGNCAATTVGSNDVSDTADILFEDNWFHGKGGRYNLLVYNANRVVVRRGVIRHDAGWTDTKGDPEAGLNFYNSTGCSAQNVVILDSNLAYQTWQAAFYSVHNSASPNTNANNSWLGIIALNNFSTSAPDGAGLRFDGNDVQTSHIVQNAVLWDNYWGMNVAYASSVGVTASGLTVGQTHRNVEPACAFNQG